MPNPDPRFTADEYAARLAEDPRRDGGEGDRAASIVSDPSNMHWLTGYDGWSFYVHQAVIVPPTGNPIWYGRGQDAAGAERTALAAGRRHRRLPRPLRAVDRAPPDGLSRRACSPSAASTGSRIGVEMDNYWFSAAAFASLQRAPAERPLLRRDRPRELAARGQEPGRDRLHAQGRPHRRGDARPHRRDRPPRHPQVRPRRRDPRRRHPRHARVRRRLPGDRAAAALRRATPPPRTSPGTTSRCRPGEGTFFEIAGCYHRYHCPLSRTVFLGKPTQEFLDAEAATLEGMEAGLAAARPGNTCEDIAKRLLRRPRASTASSRTTAPATRSASATRPTGASAP